MNFDIYEQLSEDAQRLLSYYALIGIDTGRRMNEHFYMLRRDCFPVFDGQKAQDELMRAAIFRREGRDWNFGVDLIGIETNHFVPALWYLFDRRKDILLALSKCKPIQNEKYSFVRYAVQQLVDNNYQDCPSANVIGTEQARYFYCMVGEPQFIPLIRNFSPETFRYFFSTVSEHLTECDMAVDTTAAMKCIAEYEGITEHMRCKLISEMELYNFIASGHLPSDGIYPDIASGYTLGAMRHLCAGRHAEAVRWFEQAQKIHSHDPSSNDIDHSVIQCLYRIMAFVAVVSNRDESALSPMADWCKSQLLEFAHKAKINPWRQLIPAKILAEDYLESNTAIRDKRINNMYALNDVGPTRTTYRHLAFLLANYLGCSTAGMDGNTCVPHLALLRHEMSSYIPLDEEERARLRSLYGEQTVLSTIHHKAAWASVLEDLLHAAKGDKSVDEQPMTRLMYIRPSMATRSIQVREQTRLKNGNWSGGKQLSDVRYRHGEVDCMNSADRRILARLSHSQHWDLRIEDVIEEMADDNRLYFGQSAPFQQVKVERDTPYLMVENEGGRFVVKSNVPIEKASDDIIIAEDSPTHYRIIKIPNAIQDYYVKLLQLGTLPLEAEGTLRSLLTTIGGKVELHSSLIEGGSTLPLTDGEASIGFRLTPQRNDAWEVEMFVRPLQGGRRTYKPGEGDDIIIDENEDGRVRVRRNMEAERANTAIVHDIWKNLGYEYDELDESNYYPPEFMLDLLQIIQDNPDTFYAEWPEGHNTRVRRLVRGMSNWTGVVQRRGQWFDIEGEIDIDEQTRISISQLLELVGQSRGRFVKLGDGEFLALSDQLRRQLNALDAIANRSRGAIQISPFSAALMGDDITNGVIRLQMSKELQEIRKRIFDSSAYNPEVPTELNATLRPYQLDGFRWIARLNSWGAGALLADDMGLGKTLQTIAFLLLKKNEGASLVVAPASVAPNWEEELGKFAPTLNVQILNFANDRQRTISEAKAGDVIIATYGILLSNQDDITQKQWNVACLDEAHIIKNRGAKTSAAAMKIQAKNRVMLTGTPVQNHLGELWSLFQFVNPGLLGSYEHFSHKFIVPIEGYQDSEKQEQLERIVHPFMLRRTKQAVLKELPDKMEIYHTVELNRDELAIYESIRTRAEKMLHDNGADFDMNVLAEITRLRQAACSAQLIEPKWTGTSSKITALVELLQGVTEGGNRALVFSQFVSFLDLVRKELDKLGMNYFYIDGGTPVSRRAEMVSAFQGGKNALFLISLKAGGLGLNLTGANYVFHLDPWWNPAIEQQATDRAYRIGQDQAVTVYHLISKNTIEEKIIRLHQTKRDLADNLLAGTDMSYKLTGKDLLAMLTK